MFSLSSIMKPGYINTLTWATYGMIDKIEIDNNNLSFEVVLTTPACPLKEVIRKDCESAINTKS